VLACVYAIAHVLGELSYFNFKGNISFSTLLLIFILKSRVKFVIIRHQGGVLTVFALTPALTVFGFPAISSLAGTLLIKLQPLTP